MEDAVLWAERKAYLGLLILVIGTILFYRSLRPVGGLNPNWIWLLIVTLPFVPLGSIFCVPGILVIIALAFHIARKSINRRTFKDTRGHFLRRIGGLTLALGMAMGAIVYLGVRNALISLAGHEEVTIATMRDLVEQGKKASRSESTGRLRVPNYALGYRIVISDESLPRAFSVMAAPAEYAQPSEICSWLLHNVQKIGTDKFRWPTGTRTFYANEAGAIRGMDIGGRLPSSPLETDNWPIVDNHG